MKNTNNSISPVNVAANVRAHRDMRERSIQARILNELMEERQETDDENE